MRYCTLNKLAVVQLIRNDDGSLVHRAVGCARGMGYICFTGCPTYLELNIHTGNAPRVTWFCLRNLFSCIWPLSDIIWHYLTLSDIIWRGLSWTNLPCKTKLSYKNNSLRSSPFDLIRLYIIGCMLHRSSEGQLFWGHVLVTYLEACLVPYLGDLSWWHIWRTICELLTWVEPSVVPTMYCQTKNSPVIYLQTNVSL